MSAALQKAVAMGVYDPNDIRQNFGTVHYDWGATNTKWVRFWIPWYKIAPYGWNNPATDTSLIPGEPANNYNPGAWRVMDWVAHMDAQIKLARQLGLGVILTFEWFPQWANGSTARRLPPADLSPNSPWAIYLWWIYTRWSPFNANHNGAWANVLEVCNEPNGYPGHPGAPDLWTVAGRMMTTAQAIQQSVGWTLPVMAGPALNDANFDTYTENLCGYLQANGFTGFTSSNYNWIWTHHCYGDIEANDGVMFRARRQRDRLATRGWNGWPGPPYSSTTYPWMFLTEGGSRLVNTPAADKTIAAIRVANGYDEIHNDNYNGRGLGMFTQYLDITDTDPNGDCGLREASNPYNQRPLYGTWAARPTP